jgi:hypothetical protein
MFRINTCLVDAKLTEDLENAILNVAQVEDNQALRPDAGKQKVCRCSSCVDRT